MKHQTLEEFYTRFREEVLCTTETDTSGWTTEDFLTNVMLEYLEDAGEVTDPVICPFRGYGLQLNAYASSVQEAVRELEEGGWIYNSEGKPYESG